MDTPGQDTNTVNQLQILTNMVQQQQTQMEELRQSIYYGTGNTGKGKGNYADSGDSTDKPPWLIDSKSITKPDKYNGDIRKFIAWSIKLKNYLEAKDSRWRKVLEEIEKYGYNKMDTQDEANMAINAGISTYIGEFRRQLYTYLCTFTEGASATTISAVGATGAFESYRRIADAGRSRRPEHVLKLNAEVIQPGQATDIHVAQGPIRCF